MGSYTTILLVSHDQIAFFPLLLGREKNGLIQFKYPDFLNDPSCGQYGYVIQYGLPMISMCDATFGGVSRTSTGI